GFGEQKTPESFRQACRRFIYTENLLPEAQSADTRTTGKALEPLDHAGRILTRIIADMESDDGWVALGLVGSQLANLAPDFDPRTYGVKKLSDLVRKLEALELQETESGHLRVRARPELEATPAPTRRRR